MIITQKKQRSRAWPCISYVSKT